MKILTPEEESAHNRATWEGGILGAVGGLAAGSLGVWAGTARSHAFRQLTIPFRVFLIMVPMTFGGNHDFNNLIAAPAARLERNLSRNLKLTLPLSRCRHRRLLLPPIRAITTRRLWLREQVRDRHSPARVDKDYIAKSKRLGLREQIPHCLRLMGRLYGCSLWSCQPQQVSYWAAKACAGKGVRPGLDIGSVAGQFRAGKQ
jgi:hypothetical protein